MSNIKITIFTITALISIQVFAPDAPGFRDTVTIDRDNTDEHLSNSSTRSSQRRSDAPSRRSEDPDRQSSSKTQKPSGTRTDTSISLIGGSKKPSDTQKSALDNFTQKNPKTGRTPFEEALFKKNLDQAKKMFEDLQQSSSETKEAVTSLRDLYNSTSEIVKMYPGKTAQEAREQLTQDIVDVNKHLAKTFIDSFSTRSKNKPTFPSSDNAAHETQNNQKSLRIFLKTEPKPTEILDKLQQLIDNNNTELTKWFINKAIPADKIDEFVTSISKSYTELLSKDPNEAADFATTVSNIPSIDITEPFFAHVQSKYLAYLVDHPQELSIPYRAKQSTPLEIAIADNNSTMIEQIILIAQHYKIPLTELIAPLIDKYKSLMKSQGKSEAHAFVQKVYEIGNETISHLLHEQLSKIDFSRK